MTQKLLYLYLQTKLKIKKNFKEIIMVIYDPQKTDKFFFDEFVSNLSLNSTNFGTYYLWVQSVTSQMLIIIYRCWIFAVNPMKNTFLTNPNILIYIIFFIKYLWNVNNIINISSIIIYTKIIHIIIKTCFFHIICWPIFWNVSYS